jgi:hypothetical protein
MDKFLLGGSYMTEEEIKINAEKIIATTMFTLRSMETEVITYYYDGVPHVENMTLTLQLCGHNLPNMDLKIDVTNVRNAEHLEYRIKNIMLTEMRKYIFKINEDDVNE